MSSLLDRHESCGLVEVREESTLLVLLAFFVCSFFRLDGKSRGGYFRDRHFHLPDNTHLKDCGCRGACIQVMEGEHVLYLSFSTYAPPSLRTSSRDCGSFHLPWADAGTRPVQGVHGQLRTGERLYQSLAAPFFFFLFLSLPWLQALLRFCTPCAHRCTYVSVYVYVYLRSYAPTLCGPT